MNTRVRKAAGCFVLLAYLGIYTLAATTLAPLLVGSAPAWVQLIYFAVAGVIWIFPLKPLFAWMNRGA